MKKTNTKITYLLGFLFLIALIISFIKMIQSIDKSNLYNNSTTILCYIGAFIFVLTRIVGIFPVDNKKKVIFNEIIDELFNKDKKKDNYVIPDELYRFLKKDFRNEDALNLIAKDI